MLSSVLVLHGLFVQKLPIVGKLNHLINIILYENCRSLKIINHELDFQGNYVEVGCYLE